MKILVVDDIGYSRHSLARILEHQNHTVVIAASGAEALYALDSDHKIDVVITDLLMADMDGVDLFLKAKALERIGDDGSVEMQPFILLTSAQPGRPSATTKAVNRIDLAESLGFARILFKPVEPDVLAETLRRLEAKPTSRFSNLSIAIDQLETVTAAAIDEDNVDVARMMLDRLESQVQSLREFVSSREQAATE